ncbi:flagellar associated protein [Lichtheimia corymbifera JMRC:FSU:9682]|uniref:Flagellar associated protein n=1 Tax=Lichtheimia corymbifera JMRC:FSU:9682 TaxID=1263082 RepID=A0A068RNG0_9FUNG|nr:flagellar associated protein [Lichtheimia corymbifera JMRC:FSU:9682]
MTIVPLPFEIAHCSSWDDDHSPEQLVASSPGNRKGSERLDDTVDIGDTDRIPSNKVKGWQTPKCPNYPQDLIIRLLCGPARISKVQILSHHYKIATKIDVYIGILKDAIEELDPIAPNDEDEDDMLIEFTRLGYVCLDNNTRAQYRARELKSIKVNADGEYVRLVIRNCHRNRLNTYNQVGILALNIQGQPLRQDPHCAAAAIPGHMAQYLQHPLDEATSGIIDIELQQWISALIHAEEQAAQHESYHVAKVYKDLSDRLSEFGKMVIDLELSKKHAVESKDYDEAEKIKADICEIKHAAEKLLIRANIRITHDGRIAPADSNDDELDDDQVDEALASGSMVAPYPDDDAPAKHGMEDCTLIDNEQSMPQDDLYDEAIEKWTNFDAHAAPPSAGDQSSPTSSLSTNAAEMLLPPHLTSYGHDTTLIAREDEDDDTQVKEKPAHHQVLSPSLSAAVAKKHSLRGGGLDAVGPAPAASAAPVAPAIEEEEKQPEPESTPIDPECMPEPLIDAERSNCRIPIRVFGEQVVACILSVKVKCREHGLNSIADTVKSACLLAETNQLNQLEDLMMHPNDDDGDSNDSAMNEEYDDETCRNALFIRASLMMIQEAIMDSREHIINLTLGIWRDVNDLCDVVPHALTFGYMERAFSGLLMRTNDANTRIRSSASELVLELASKFPEPPHSLLTMFIGKPDRVIHNHKDARARIDLVSSAVSFLCIHTTDNKAGLIPLDTLMDFVVTYLNHSHDEVRKAAVELVIDISEQVGFQSVSKYIDKDLRLSLAETVKKVAESNAPANDKKTTTKSKNNNSSFGGDGTVAELRALAAKATKVPASEKKSATATTKAGTVKRKAAAATTEKKTTTTRGTAATKKTTTATSTRTARGTTKATKSTAPAQQQQQQDPAADAKNMCIFCEEVNPNFNEDTLISHYYDSCPVLTSCVRCQTILEISTLHDHTFTDCAKRHLIKQCTRCKQAIPVEQWLQHTLKSNCKALNDNDVCCPLCMTAIDPPTDSQWRAHLLNGNGCPKNPRQVRRAAPAANTATKATKTAATRSEAKTSARQGTKTPNSSLRRKK